MIGEEKVTARPIIGVTMSLEKSGMIREGVEYSFIRREYGEELKAAGAQPLFLDSSIDPEVAARLCDGIVISGGEDIDPSMYGDVRRCEGKIEPIERTQWERRLIDACDAEGIPILGVCYGHQLLNIHYGGTLYQDVETELTGVFHGNSTGAVMHETIIEQEFLGFESGQVVSTASRHHQAVKDIAPGFQAIARSKDGVIEAIAGHGHYGIQWHSESDGTANQIYGSFVSICAAKSEYTEPEKLVTSLA